MLPVWLNLATDLRIKRILLNLTCPLIPYMVQKNTQFYSNTFMTYMFQTIKKIEI